LQSNSFQLRVEYCIQMETLTTPPLNRLNLSRMLNLTTVSTHSITSLNLTKSSKINNFQFLADLKNLKSLNLTKCQIKDEDLRFIGPEITELIFSHNQYITGYEILSID
jgi:hypothetical protein